MIIFSNGGERKENYGVAMYYRYNRFYLTISTENKEWTVFTNKISINVAVRIEISWSVQYGLSLYLDGNKVAHTTHHIIRTGTIIRSTDFFIGWQIKLNIFSKITISGWNVVYAHKEIDRTVPELGQLCLFASVVMCFCFCVGGGFLFLEEMFTTS